MTGYSQSATSGRRLGRPRTNTCDACRAAKVKCDQRHPGCSRCSRLRLRCSWPPKTINLPVTRVSTERKRKLLPMPTSEQITVDDKSPGICELNDSSSTNFIPQSVPGTPDNIVCIQDLAEFTLPPYTESELDISWPDTCLDFSGLLYSSSLFLHDNVLDSSLVLSGDEYQALSHYQETFISDRVLKTPRWSMFSCILRSVSQVPMAMHLLIAISSMDLNQRSPRPAISLGVTRTHFRKGSEMLIQRMSMEESKPDHFSILASWLFLYLCMTHREILNRKAVDKLSMAISNYIQRYNLDRLCAAIPSQEPSVSSAWEYSSSCLSTEPGLLGRLLLFLASEDIRMGFEECGGHLAKHLLDSEDLYWRIYSQQRYILERFWGQSYPENEVMHDLETAEAMELGHKVGLLVHRVNELSKNTLEEVKPRDLDIERGIVDIETQYSSILRMTRSLTASRSPFLRVAEAAVISLYFVKLYYFRLTLRDCAAPTPPHILLAMTELLNMAHRAFSEQARHWGHGIFQLPLFMAAVETKDRIHIEWIMSKMGTLRFRTALSQIILIQDQTGSRLSIANIRQILESSVRFNNAAFPIDE